MTAFDPPSGDCAGLNGAATLLGTVSSELSGDLSATTGAVQTVVADWRGTRKNDFARAAGGVQVQLKLAGDGCASVATLLTQYAKAFDQACVDVAEYKRLSENALTSAAAQTKTLDSAQQDLTFQHASMRSGQYQADALAAKSSLARLAGSIALQIDAETDRVAPVSSSLSPDQIRRQVDTELGLTGLSGTSAATMTADQAWALLGGAGRAVASGAVNADGSVDWTQAFALPAVPPSGTDPQTVNDWWNGLSPSAQDDLLNSEFGQLGNLDGVPVLDRDYANRLNLPVLTAGVQSQINALGPAPAKYGGPAYGRFGPIPGAETSAWSDWNDTMTALQQRLDGLSSVASTLSKTSPAPLFLIGLQDVGNGRAIISTGDPDTASNVATYVPGMGTKLTGIGGGVDRANAMYGSAIRAGATAPASVTWYGYDAPQGLGAAAGDDDAQKGATLLDSFQNGLRLTHVGAASLNTVVAHSYGTTVTGYAASHGNSLNVDNIVFVASPGVTVDNVGDLRLTGAVPGGNAQHVYATVAEYDPIRLAAGINGPDPTGLDFGARDFSADPEEGHWYLLGWNTDAHSSYWKSDNISLRNIGLIVAGAGDQTK